MFAVLEAAEPEDAELEPDAVVAEDDEAAEVPGDADVLVTELCEDELPEVELREVIELCLVFGLTSEDSWKSGEMSVAACCVGWRSFALESGTGRIPRGSKPSRFAILA